MREIMRSLSLRMQGTHQLKAGLWSITRILAYSAVSTGCDSLRSARFFLEIEPPFH
jgi:hypothetical protein